jgi:hypothetical protein
MKDLQVAPDEAGTGVHVWGRGGQVITLVLLTFMTSILSSKMD